MKKILFFAVVMTAAMGVFAQADGPVSGVSAGPNPEDFFTFPTDGKIQGFTIFFAGNVADFTDLPENVRNWNKNCIAQLKTFLDANPQYRLIVKGCVNGTSEKNLDEARIEQAIKLAHFEGIPKDRVAQKLPLGGKEMLAPVGSENEWINRRVDFVLVLR